MENQTPNVSESEFNQPDQKIGFWRRQFRSEATVKQKVFDWIFGIVLPVICFTFDPIVFSGNGWAPFGEYKPFAYLLNFASIMMLMAFLLWGRKLKWVSGFLSGLFALGGTISLIVGIVIFPLSIIGLIILIGVLGFTPLFSAFVYWRNAVRAYKYAHPILGTQNFIYAAALTAIFGFAVPYVVNVKIQNELKTIEGGDVRTIQGSTERLWVVSPILNPAIIFRASFDENSDRARKLALRESYKKLSGDDPVVWK
jgi:hypothetical protein